MKQNNVVKTVLIEESAGVQSCRKGFPESTTSSSRKLREEKNTRAGNQGPRSTDGTESRRLSLCARGASTSNSPSRPLPFPPRCILFIPRPRTWFSLRPLEASEARMVNYDSGANHPETPQPGFLSRYVFSANHKTIGLNYLWLALFSVFLGMAMSLLMRIHFVWPGAHLPFLSSLGNSPDRFCRSHHTPWFADGFSGAHRRAPGRLRQLFSPAANRRTRSGLPHTEPPRVLGHSGLVRGHDGRVLNLSPIGNHAVDRQRRHLLCCVPSQRAQFQRHYYRSARQRNVAPAHAHHGVGVVHQRHPGHADFQHSPGGLRLPALGSPLEHAFFSPR